MEEVNKRWKTYLKKCHPDRYANDPGKLTDATELTQALTGAHDTIQAAWKRYQART
jgi:curved DNA-binding protein CbpA